MHDDARLFENLSPPPGGLDRLRRAIRQAPRRSSAPWWAPALAGAAWAFVLAVVVAPAWQQWQQGRQIRDAVSAAADASGGWLELPSGDPSVRLYLATPENIDESGSMREQKAADAER